MSNTIKKKSSVQSVDLTDVIAPDNKAENIDLTVTTPGVVKIDDSTIVSVKSNVFGKLIYVNKKTGDSTEWEQCGIIQPMSIGDLRAMKASQSDFFKNQWVIITGFADGNENGYTIADIYKALYITQYYKELIEPSNFEEVCSWAPDTIASKVSYMSRDAKANLAIALNEYVQKGVLDSLKAIKAFEEVLGCELKIPK